METKMIIQKLNKPSSDEFSRAEIYYNLLSSVNGLYLTEREIQLIAYVAIRGNITTPNVRVDFCEKYNTTGPTISNIVSKLKKKNIFVKEKGKVKVNPKIVLDFSKNIVMQIQLS